MATNSWCRLWSDMPNDPKWRTIARVSGQRVGDVVAVFVHMMTCASTQTNATERGRIMGWEDEDVATALDLETAQVTAIRNAMDGRVLDGDHLDKWEKRQPIREDENGPARAKAWREAQKATANAKGKTQPNATERIQTLDKIREDKDISKPKPSSSSGDDGVVVRPFDRFWQAYPRRVGKNAAQKAWAKLKPDAALVEQLLAAITAQREGADWRRDDGEFIPHPASWLNGGRWLDEVRAFVEPAPKHGAWWASKESMESFGRSLVPPLAPLQGEYPSAYAERIRAALENAGKPVEMPRPAVYIPPPPRGGESSLSPAQLSARRAEMLAAAGSRKPAAAGVE